MIASEKPPPRLKKRRLSTRQRKHAHFSRGKQFENQATAYLEQHGFVVLARNIRWKNYELDIVARDPDNQDLVFIEVKGRQSADYGSPAEAVTWRKQQSLLQAAQAYRYHTGQTQIPFRFDIIALTSGTITHYQNIIW